MKTTTMKKVLLGFAALLLVSLFGFNQEVIAQTNMTVSAAIVQQIQVDREEDLDFGFVVQGENKTIFPNGDINQGATFDDGNPGIYQVQKSNLPVTLRFTALPENLVGPDGALLPLSFDDVDNEEMGAISETIGGAFVQRFSPTAIVDLEGGASDNLPVFFIFIGGTVQPVAEQAPGEYQGTITLEVTYN